WCCCQMDMAHDPRRGGHRGSGERAPASGARDAARDADTLAHVTDRAAVIDWLLDPEHSDPSIRWQVMRDLLDAPQSEWAAERARVATESVGARLLALQGADGYERSGGGRHGVEPRAGLHEARPLAAPRAGARAR